MWSDNDKAIELAAQLIALTNGKKITWRRISQPANTRGNRYYFDFVYTAQIGKDIFRLSDYRSKDIYDGERFHGNSGVELEIIDEEGRSLWACPPNPAVRDLFEIVVETTADIDGVMERLTSFAKAS